MILEQKPTKIGQKLTESRFWLCKLQRWLSWFPIVGFLTEAIFLKAILNFISSLSGDEPERQRLVVWQGEFLNVLGKKVGRLIMTPERKTRTTGGPHKPGEGPSRICRLRTPAVFETRQ